MAMLKAVLLLAFWLAGVSVYADGHGDKPGHHRAIEQACTDLVLDYAYYRDRADAQAVADLFTADALLRVLGQDFDGNAAIRSRIEQGRGGPVFRHMMSTVRIFVEDEDHARGVSYVTVYSAPAGELPRPLGAPLGVGEYHDQFVRTEAGWKIQRREFVPAFMPEQ